MLESSCLTTDNAPAADAEKQREGITLAEYINRLRFFKDIATALNITGTNLLGDYTFGANGYGNAFQDEIQILQQMGQLNLEFVEERLFLGGDLFVSDLVNGENESSIPYIALLAHDVLRSAGEVCNVFTYRLISERFEMDVIGPIERTIKLCEIVERGISSENNIFKPPLKFDDLLATIDVPQNVAITTSNDLTFLSLEEYITVRTLICNALKAGNVHNIFINNIEPEHIFQIVDDGEMWRGCLLPEMDQMYCDGQNNKDIFYPKPIQGLSIAAYRAGQRGDVFCMDSTGSLKSIFIGFPN